MKDSDEANGSSLNSFTYKCGATDRGRFRLTTANFRSRYPIRVLRSHALSSLYAPRAGLRYDGLHRVVGWTLRPVDPATNNGLQLMYDVKFERDDPEAITSRILQYPRAEDLDDYNEYRFAVREQKEAKGIAPDTVSFPITRRQRVRNVRSTLDGSTDVFFDSIDWNPCDVVLSDG
jgi:hypothetical protein